MIATDSNVAGPIAQAFVHKVVQVDGDRMFPKPGDGTGGFAYCRRVSAGGWFMWIHDVVWLIVERLGGLNGRRSRIQPEGRLIVWLRKVDA